MTALIKVGNDWFEQGSDAYYLTQEPAEQVPAVETARILVDHFFCRQRRITGPNPTEALVSAIIRAGLNR